MSSFVTDERPGITVNFSCMQIGARSKTRPCQAAPVQVSATDALGEAAKTAVSSLPEPASTSFCHGGRDYFLKYSRRGELYSKHELDVVLELNNADWRRVVGVFFWHTGIIHIS